MKAKKVKESLQSSKIIQNSEDNTYWKCVNDDYAKQEFDEFVTETLENPELLENFLLKNLGKEKEIWFCENIPCLAGDDIFVIYFPESGQCACTFDGFISICEETFESIDEALDKILINP